MTDIDGNRYATYINNRRVYSTTTSYEVDVRIMRGRPVELVFGDNVLYTALWPGLQRLEVRLEGVNGEDLTKYEWDKPPRTGF